MLVLILGCAMAVSAGAQTLDEKRLVDEIAYNADIMVNANLDQHRIRASESMGIALDSLLAHKGSYEVSLDSIPWLSIVHGADFRLVTWQLKVSNEEYKYGGFIQWPDRIVRFKDTRPFINGSSYSTYTPSSWYGCIYYHIIPFELDGKSYYVLLGFNAENSTLNTKVADVLDLTGPDIRLGVPVFTGKEEARTRLMVTYGDISNTRMTYDSKLGGIIHDHVETLPGIGPNGEDLPVSDGSMEAWILKKGKWEYQEEVYDVKVTEPPMTNERKNRVEDKDILGRPKKE
ncbi:MAG: hypothetical protein KBA14_00615 [Saprospiraceae bacterium]|nr:hypothetical protein [Saprospiraceae bacterium]